MKDKNDQLEEKRLKEIEELFHAMQEKTEKYQKYFAAQAKLPQVTLPKRAYARYGDSTRCPGEPDNARLEPNLKRD